MSWKSCSTDSHHHDRSSVKTKHLSSKQKEGAKNRKIFVHPDALVGWPGRTAIASLTCIRAQNKLLIHIKLLAEMENLFIFNMSHEYEKFTHIAIRIRFLLIDHRNPVTDLMFQTNSWRERELENWNYLGSSILIRKLSIRWTQIFDQKMYADSIFIHCVVNHNQEFRLSQKHKHSKILILMLQNQSFSLKWLMRIKVNILTQSFEFFSQNSLLSKILNNMLHNWIMT